MALVLFAWLIVGGGAINYVIQSVICINHYILLLLTRYHYRFPPAGLTGVLA